MDTSTATAAVAAEISAAATSPPYAPAIYRRRRRWPRRSAHNPFCRPSLLPSMVLFSIFFPPFFLLSFFRASFSPHPAARPCFSLFTHTHINHSANRRRQGDFGRRAAAHPLRPLIRHHHRIPVFSIGPNALFPAFFPPPPVYLHSLDIVDTPRSNRVYAPPSDDSFTAKISVRGQNRDVTTHAYLYGITYAFFRSRATVQQPGECTFFENLFSSVLSKHCLVAITV